jgi:starch synthase
MSALFGNFIFLNGYSEKCADALYASGDLFLMPSSFEPCGIGQMLAMRDGQPSVVHHVGGLKDTVRHNYNGFVFTGKGLTEQVDNFIHTTKAALDMKKNSPDQWEKICRQAAEERFDWQKSAAEYINSLYRKEIMG